MSCQAFGVRSDPYVPVRRSMEMESTVSNLRWTQNIVLGAHVQFEEN